MDDLIKTAFDGITADDAVKANTMAYVTERTARRPIRSRISGRRFAAALTAIVLVIGALGSYNAYAAPVSYIEINVNPSVELALNRFDRVVSAEGKNEEGEAVLEGLSLKQLAYEDAIDAVLQSIADNGYLGEGAQVTFTVESRNRERLENGICSCGSYNRYNCILGNSDGGGSTGHGTGGADPRQQGGPDSGNGRQNSGANGNKGKG